MEATRVLLVDAHPVVREGCKAVLEATDDISVVAAVDNSQDALAAYAQSYPSIVVIDPALDGVGGHELARRLLSRDSEARILIFTAHDNDISLRRALELGVLGYLSKRRKVQEFVEGVRMVSAGEVYIDPTLTPQLVKAQMSREGERVSRLSAREFEVFRLVAEGHSIVGVAELLNVSPKTVGHHFTRAKKKLGVANLAELTRLAIRTGLLVP